MCGIFPHVSTLLILVGLPNSPLTAGNGGRVIGIPRRPSMLAMSAVSSPQTNAPAPSLMTISNEKSDPRIFSPSSPHPRICSIAIRSRSIASGYSARI